MSEYVNMVQIPEVTRNQLLEYLKDDDKEAWNIKPMVVGLTDYCEKVPRTPVLGQFLTALGWQRGTIHEALAEVRRLVEVKKTALFYTSDWNGANHNDPEIARLAVERLANLHDLLVLKSRA